MTTRVSCALPMIVHPSPNGRMEIARLATFTRAGLTTTSGWQATPNRSSVQVGLNPALTSTFDDANRPTADSAGGTYASDADGRLTVQPGYRSTWDALGRLTTVLPPSGRRCITTRGAIGRRCSG